MNFAAAKDVWALEEVGSKVSEASSPNQELCSCEVQCHAQCHARHQHQHGFTLLEVLIAMSIIVMILGLLGSALITGTRAVTQIVSLSELIEDSRVSGLMIADSVGRARYVYPLGVNLTLSSTKTYSVQNPSSSSNTWTIGTDPIIAYIEAADEANPAILCQTDATLQTATSKQPPANWRPA
jgi:prepilin-type N-terminal cleavage/methylation domain-containing protein